jgi:hypothetical protein
MFAIGVLVPLSSGRLGKSWRHAPRLKELTLFVFPPGLSREPHS